MNPSPRSSRRRVIACTIALLAVLAAISLVETGALKDRDASSPAAASREVSAPESYQPKNPPPLTFSAASQPLGDEVQTKRPRSAGRILVSQPAGLPDAPDARPLEKLLTGRPVVLLDHGQPVAFELALDEVYLPSAPVGQRLKSLAATSGAADMLQSAKKFTAADGTPPQLVLYPAGAQRTESARRILTDQVQIQFNDPGVAEKVVTAAGLRIVSRPAYAPGYVVAEPIARTVAGGLAAIAALEGKVGVVSAAPLLARQQAKKVLPTDQWFSQQWHLRNTGQGGGRAGTDAAVANVWEEYLGTGVTIGIVDDGVQLNHPDLSPNADVTRHYDWNDSPEDTNPAPDVDNEDFHGTSVAGVAAARGYNGIGVTGAAPQATIVGFRLIADFTTDLEEAQAMSLHNGVIDIKSNSWGTPDDEPWVLGTTGPLFRNALMDGATNGRGGLGIIYPWAAGNGAEYFGQANKDGYTNSIYVLAVGAIANTGGLSSYSETGSNLAVAAPSNGGTLGIVTTDLTGNAGYNYTGLSGELSDRNYTNDFGGTSSATPLVSGVVALMLEANPALTWRDVKEILLRSSTRLLPTDSGWVSRIVGDPDLAPIKHHHAFGGGMINAEAAVAMAEKWRPGSAMIQMNSSVNYGSPGALIPDNNITGIQTTFNYTAQPAMRVEHVEVTISASHTFRGDLEILLTSPAGVVSTLAAVSGIDYEDDGSTQYYSGWVFSSMRHWGESSIGGGPSAGIWRVTVRDRAAADVGRLQSVGIRFSGIAAPAQDITVEDDTSTDVADGSIVDLEEVAVDNPLEKTFTLKNIGDHALTGIGFTLDGPDAADFSVSALPASLNASGRTTFTVEFAPSTTGGKQAFLHIVSNDPDEPSFDIELVGHATPPVGRIVFADTGFVVEETDGTITVPVTRTGGSYGAVTVDVVASHGGTASSDYTMPVSSTLSFSSGAVAPVTELQVGITTPDASEANETFYLTLSNPTARARLGTPAQVPVTIIDPTSSNPAIDKTVPFSLVISYPATNNALVGLDSHATVDITGSVKDNKGVRKVEVALNSGVPTEASLSIPGGISTAFTLPLEPRTGANRIVVKVTDYAGNSTTMTRDFKVMRPLLVDVDDTLGSVTTGYAGSTFREVDKSHTVAAMPKAVTTTFEGALFLGWSVGGVDVARGNIPFTNSRLGIVASSLTKNSLTFTFREGLELTPMFIPSPFVAGVYGTYNGLVTASSSAPSPGGTSPRNSTEGHLNVEVQKTGAFSGKLTMDGLVLNVSGMFDELGRARFGTARTLALTVARTNKPSLTLTLDLGLAGGPALPVVGKISGTVTAKRFQQSVIDAVSDVDADKAHFTGLTQLTSVDESYLTVPASPTAVWPGGRTDGTFTVVLPPVAPASQPDRIRVGAAFTERDYPQGDGFGTIKVGRDGKVTLAGTLADGTTVSASGTLSSDYRVALFSQIYSKLGYLGGWVKLNNGEADSDMRSLDGLLWGRPAIGGTHYYPRGWAESLKVDLIAAKYEAKNNQSILTASTNVQIRDDVVSGNAELIFSKGQLGPGVELMKVAYLSKADLVTTVPDNDPTFTLKMDRKTGGFSGTFTHVDDTKPAYKGIIYQKGARAGGYGYFMTVQPRTIDYMGESGSVRMDGVP